MSNWDLLDFDVDGSAVYFDYDEATDTVLTKRTADVEPELEEAKRVVNEEIDRKSEFRRIMSIPMGAAWTWAQLNGLKGDPDWWKKIFGRGGEELLSRLVHDRDMRGFRTLAGDYRQNFKRR